MHWEIVYLEAAESWLNRLSKPQLQSMAKEMKLLGYCGNQLRLPHSKSLGDGLFELRERRFGLRMYYSFGSGKEILLLFGGDKSSQKKDIKKAKELFKRYRRG